MTVIHAVIDVLVALAALVAILDYFGLKPKQPLWGLAMPLGRNWKLAIMLGLVIAALGMSGYGFYRSLRPNIVERIVEKPVDRIVEKIVPAECPKCQTVPAPKRPKGQQSSTPIPTVVIPPGTTINATTNAPGSAAVGINTGTVNVGSPERVLSKAEHEAVVEALKPGKGLSASVWCYSGDPGGCKYANYFFSAFRDAEWNVGRQVAIISAVPDDSEVRIGIKTPDARPPGFNEIREALRAIGITPRGLAFPTDPQMKVGEVRLFIGMKKAD